MIELENPVIKPLKSKYHYYELMKDYDFYFKMPELWLCTFHIAIKKGYRFDGASIPSALWGFPLMLSPAHPRIVLASLIHDLCYETKGHINKSEYATLYKKRPNDLWHKDNTTITKELADKLFLNINTIMGMDIVRRHITYAAVRLFGRY